jgi:ferredoxin
LDCYVKGFKPDGSVVVDDHALGCSLCVDIARDVMRLHGEGQSIKDIRAEIVATYSKFGPPNQ